MTDTTYADNLNRARDEARRLATLNGWEYYVVQTDYQEFAAVDSKKYENSPRWRRHEIVDAYGETE